MRHERSAFLASLLALVAVPVRAATLELPSVWVAPAATANGTAVPWEGVLLPLGDTGLSVALRNDRDFLYIRVRTSDPETRRQLLVTGLTIWADGRGKSKKEFGVRFPLGQTRFRDRGAAPGDGPSAGETPHADELEVIGPGEDDRISIPAAGGDAARASLDAGPDVLALEVRLPLHPTAEHPLAVGAAPGATIAVGFETEKPREPGRDSGGGGGFRAGLGGGAGHMGEGGGMRGRGMRGGSEGMRGRGERGDSIQRPIKTWTRIVLATEPPARTS